MTDKWTPKGKVQWLFLTKIHLGHFLCGLFFWTGCTPARLPEYPIQKVDAYPNRVHNEGLVVAIHPIVSGTECERYFGGNMVGDGVLPVLVVMENRSADASFLVSQDQCFLISGNNEGHVISQNDLPSGHARMWLAGGGLLGYAWSAPAFQMRYSLLANEFKTHTLSPGRSENGFLFFERPHTNQNEMTLQVNAQILGTDKNLSLGIPFIGKGD